MGFQNYIEELNTAHAVFIDENQVNFKTHHKNSKKPLKKQEKTKKKNKFNKNENW